MDLNVFIFILSFLDMAYSLQQYTIEQAIDDNTQLRTFSFNGLAFISGNSCADSFLPPGKFADFFGFQSMRDNAPNGMGHAGIFLDNASNGVLSLLTDAQKNKLIAYGKLAVNTTTSYALNRFPLMVAFRRQLAGSIPSGSTGLNQKAVEQFSSDLYDIDTILSLDRAKLYSEIILSLTDAQKVKLSSMVSGGFYSWANLTKQVDTKDHNVDVAVTSFAGDILAWFGGTIDNFTYFCPERQGDYFGSFYLKDAPAMGNQNYQIPLYITGDGGTDFLNLLDSSQQKTIKDLVTLQKTALLGIVDRRRKISLELMKPLSGGTIDENQVKTWNREYGAFDGDISFLYATAYANVSKTLNQTQREKIMKLRNLDNYPCEEGRGYVYADKGTYPTVQNTDFLFFSAAGSTNTNNQTSGNNGSGSMCNVSKVLLILFLSLLL